MDKAQRNTIKRYENMVASNYQELLEGFDIGIGSLRKDRDNIANMKPDEITDSIRADVMHDTVILLMSLAYSLYEIKRAIKRRDDYKASIKMPRTVTPKAKAETKVKQ